MKNQFSAVAVGLALAASLLGCSNGSNSNSNSSSAAAAADSKTSGPSPYHAEYSKITHTLVTLKDFDIRTEEGKVIHVDTAPMQVDLQLLAGFAQGLNLDLTNVTFPDGLTEIHVAEIKTDIVSKESAVIQLNDGTDCKLKHLPKTLNLYTAQAITLSHNAYHLKVGFTALNSIEIDEVVDNSNCKDGHDQDDKSLALHSSSHDSGDQDHDDGKNCSCAPSDKRTCSIVNRRQLVPGIPLAIDDNF